nr:ABC transporter permease subunit [Actinomadura kijaniata]
MDLALLNYVSTFTAQDKGAISFKLVADSYQGTSNSFALLTGKDSGIATPADPRGKKIAVPAVRSVTDLLPAVRPKTAGLDPARDVTVTPIPLASMGAALKQGSVDAVAAVEPFATGVQNEHGARRLADLVTGPTRDFPIAGWGGTARFAEKNPKTVAAFQRATGKALKIAADRDEVVKAIPASPPRPPPSPSAPSPRRHAAGAGRRPDAGVRLPEQDAGHRVDAGGAAAVSAIARTRRGVQGVAAFLAVAELTSRSGLPLPPVSAVLAEAGRLAGDTAFLTDVRATVTAWLLGLAVAAALPRVEAVARPVLEFLRPIPAMAIIPLALPLFPDALDMKTSVIVYTSCRPVLINTVYGLREVAKETLSSFGLAPVHRDRGAAVGGHRADRRGERRTAGRGSPGIGTFTTNAGSSDRVELMLAATVWAGALGLAAGRSERLSDHLAPLVHFFRAIPPPALVPVFIVLFEIGTRMQLATIVFGVVWPVQLNSLDGARHVDPLQLETARAFRLPRTTRVTRIILPAAAPKIFAGLRLSLSTALILMVVSELVGSVNGIGYLRMPAQSTTDVPGVWTGIVLLDALGPALNTAFLTVERRALAWHHGAQRL